MRCTPIRHMPTRCAHEAHAYGMHAYEGHAHEVYPHELLHALEMYAGKVWGEIQVSHFTNGGVVVDLSR
jgi:hypothetical protein